ncbi:LPO_1073/Vpar_1526 family protein [Streptomyces reticuli]|uniref:LPO_1073/Vpar_1526 family protein n=1 Tax=Streptomyces reticuli TaxID=1926 RepID=UPI00073DC950|nr:hypothetical protein [Streptomyces sp. SID7810]CUW30941.1 hypothetical protein TUE45_05676 [Streptomyces reticuli]
MKWETQKQTYGSNSVNLQVGGDAYLGLSYRDVRDVAKETAMEIFRESFAALSREAYAIATSRAEEFTDNLLNELRDKPPSIFTKLQDPGVQAAVFDAQAGYAKTGMAELGELLVGILVERISRDTRDVAQLSLEAALRVAQNLATPHLSLLTCNFFLKHVAFADVRTDSDIATNLKVALEPYIDDVYSLGQPDLDYLVSVGCLILGSGSMSPGRYMGLNYPGIFSEGFTLDDFPPGRSLVETPLVERRPGNTTERYRVCAITTAELDSMIEGYGLEELRDSAQTALRMRLPSDERILDQVLANDPSLRPFFLRWRAMNMSSYLNTSVAVAIGHANARRVTAGQFNVPVDQWLSSGRDFG